MSDSLRVVALRHHLAKEPHQQADKAQALDRVRVCAEGKRRYVQALADALAAGCSAEQVAQAAGVKVRAVYQALARAKQRT